jgi:hypothetical protein
MSDTPEMEDRFMGEILADFYKRVSELDANEEFAIVLTGDQDGMYRAAVIAGGDAIMAKGASSSWFEAVSRAVARGLVAVEVIQDRIMAAHEDE